MVLRKLVMVASLAESAVAALPAAALADDGHRHGWHHEHDHETMMTTTMTVVAIIAITSRTTMTGPSIIVNAIQSPAGTMSGVPRAAARAARRA